MEPQVLAAAERLRAGLALRGRHFHLAGRVVSLCAGPAVVVCQRVGAAWKGGGENAQELLERDQGGASLRIVSLGALGLGAAPRAGLGERNS